MGDNYDDEVDGLRRTLGNSFSWQYDRALSEMAISSSLNCSLSSKGSSQLKAMEWAKRRAIGVVGGFDNAVATGRRNWRNIMVRSVYICVFSRQIKRSQDLRISGGAGVDWDMRYVHKRASASPADTTSAVGSGRVGD